MLPVNDRRAIPADELALLSSSAKLLLQNEQTTQSTTTTVTRLGMALGHRVRLFPRWDEICIRVEGPVDGHYEIVGATPAGVDMNKVVAAMKVIDDVCDGRINVAAARSSLDAIARYPPVGLARFAVFAGAGAAALGVIFGTVHWHALMLIAFSAGLGAYLRRGLDTRRAQPAPLPALRVGFVHLMRSGLLAATLPAIHALTSSSIHPTEFDVI